MLDGVIGRTQHELEKILNRHTFSKSSITTIVVEPPTKRIKDEASFTDDVVDVVQRNEESSELQTRAFDNGQQSLAVGPVFVKAEQHVAPSKYLSFCLRSASKARLKLE